MVATGRKRAASSDKTAAAELRKQRARISLSQQHNEVLELINDHLRKHPSIVPAVLQALRFGMFVPVEEKDEDNTLMPTLTHNFVRWKDTPSWLAIRMLMRAGLKEAKLDDLIKIAPNLPDQLFFMVFALDPAAKVNSKMRNVVEGALMRRYLRAGNRIDKLGLKTQDLGSHDLDSFWPAFGVYRLLPETTANDKPYKEVKHIPSDKKVNIEKLGITKEWDLKNMHLEVGAGSACAIHPDEVSTVLFHKLFKEGNVFDVCSRNEVVVPEDQAKDHLSDALELGSPADKTMQEAAMRIAKSKRGRRGAT